MSARGSKDPAESIGNPTPIACQSSHKPTGTINCAIQKIHSYTLRENQSCTVKSVQVIYRNTRKRSREKTGPEEKKEKKIANLSQQGKRY